MSGKLEERGTRKLSLVLGAEKFEEIFLFFLKCNGNKRCVNWKNKKNRFEVFIFQLKVLSRQY